MRPVSAAVKGCHQNHTVTWQAVCTSLAPEFTTMNAKDVSIKGGYCFLLQAKLVS